MFKAGDKVVCVDAVGLSSIFEGFEYTVEGMLELESITYVVLKGVHEDAEYELRGWYPERFELIK